jgi:hypothetical protein
MIKVFFCDAHIHFIILTRQYIKAADIEKVYVLPGNGRIYFAFGNSWGKLKNPVNIILKNPSGSASKGELSQTITLTHFFNNRKPLTQSLLQVPIFIEKDLFINTNDSSRHLNKHILIVSKEETVVTLTKSGNGFTASATGRLGVKQKMTSNKN